MFCSLAISTSLSVIFICQFSRAPLGKRVISAVGVAKGEVGQVGAPLRGELMDRCAEVSKVAMSMRDVGRHQGMHPRESSFMVRVIRCPRYALAAPWYMSILTS